ncbi:class I SAM-dependent methyltransferase [Novosphingobium sp.]|uniref:class I SAM-dependent methyltransferase n=1 Tax=Novosphingobium sp. TaxID=1874826 RepID=UPI0022BF0134|nr:class I SAM-dependent methyltransferase [Novosphingobium sp.]MCZ8019830.1 class I SAM-dependent methyltransferase [Novosphingobium sp.]MCZ8035844.1 class I SAM-dependent methyltransferase [Novosphingobium sp.]MCZ8052721.1 class I SAM-dependent methyltransferase [Novosphingobium sp.]MCZ8060826.1 class I SAM-dependent methyltransferase [Novosphingobium sp.]MCZ8233397.1 class I SAM-dependent methyltransferase [Novosphingobium sp.]
MKQVFDKCSDKYIAFSYICSMGFTERWREQCVAALGADADLRVGYDLMAGTGEAWPHLMASHPSIERIVAVDISSGMHSRAMERLHTMRAHRIEFIEDDVLASNLPDSSADFVISTFGLKTFNAAQHAQLAALTARVLKPGGRFACIEASDPKGWILRWLYLFHLKFVLPMIERIFLRGAQDFSMIGTYSTTFGDASQFVGMLRSEGLDARFGKAFFGCATIASGHKPV